MDNISQFEDRATIEHEAREWLVRLDGDDALSPAEKQALQIWLSRSPSHRQELERLAEFWDSSNVLTELYIPMHQVAGAQQRPDRAVSLIDRLFTPRGGFAVALSVLLTVFMLRGYIITPPLDATNGIYASAIGELREEKLADGSILQINTDSQVQVDFSDPVRKIRLLRGEAHFKVAHDKQRPFEVYAGKGRVQAVGTAFSVRLNQNDRLDVIVTDGRVALAAAVIEPVSSPATTPKVATNNKPPKATTRLKTVGTLTQGEGMSFNTDSRAGVNNYKLAQQDIERSLSWRNGYLVFNGEPLSLVVKELNRYMPITVEINGPALSQLPIGGRFKVGELDALFDVLETNFGIEVSRLDDQRVQLSPRL